MMDSFVKIENTELSNSKLVTRFMRGLAMQCPKKPKYKDTWDPAPILENIAEWGEPETLSYEKLSKRTLLLFLLSTAGRMQTAYLLNREDFSWDPEGVSIDFSERLKTNAPGTLSFRFDYLKEEPRCCVAKHLQLLNDHEAADVALPYFWTTLGRKPYHRASQETLSRYMRGLLQELGVDTDYYKSHSTRAAASSASLKALTLEELLKWAGWRSSHTFQRFYNKPLQKKVVATNLIPAIKAKKL